MMENKQIPFVKDESDPKATQVIKGRPVMYEGITPSVPTGFVTKLKRIDKGLDCHFDRAYGRFVITQTGKISGKRIVGIVKGDEGGGYRYPDNRDINYLHAADTHRKGQELKDRIRQGEEYIKARQDKDMDNAADAIKHATKIDKHQLMKAYADDFNLGKFNSTYRRVDHKSKGRRTERKGYTVIDKRNIA